jgi:hypothetical protein
MTGQMDCLRQVADLLAAGRPDSIIGAESLLSQFLAGSGSPCTPAIARTLQLLREMSVQASSLLAVRIEQSPLAVPAYGSPLSDPSLGFSTGIEG